MGDKMDPAVQKCITALNQSKNDTEKMAALFLVTKVVKATKLTKSSKMSLFEAIGFKFLLRLLKTPSSNEVPSLLYKSVALSILTAFCTEHTIAENPEMLRAIPDFIKILEEADESEDEDDQLLMVVSETYQALKCIASVEKGREALVKTGAIEKLCSLYNMHAFNSEAGIEVIAIAGSKMGGAVWEKNPECFTELIERLAFQFESDQSEQKFEICSLIAGILPTYNISKRELENLTWPPLVLRAITDILSSKIGEKQRNPTLLLASQLLLTFGTDWLINTSDESNPYQFFMLLTHLSCIEVRMILEDKSFDRIFKKENLLGSCFAIIQTSCKFMSTHHFENLDEKQKEQVCNSLKGAFKAVLLVINMIQNEAEKNPKKFWTEKKKIFASACTKCLACWLAEDTSTMKDEVFKVLPFVLALTFETFQDLEQIQTPENQVLAEMGKCMVPILPEVLVSLLPALCHLTAEERGARMLLEAEGEEHLFRFLCHNWSVYKNLKDFLEKASRPRKTKNVTAAAPSSVQEETMLNSSPESIKVTLLRIRVALMNTINLFINMTVLDPESATSSPLFQRAMRWCFTCLPALNTSEEDLPIMSNVSALGLILLCNLIKRCQTMKDTGKTLSPEDDFLTSQLTSGSDNSVFKFGQSVVKFIWEAHLPDESQSPVALILTPSYRCSWAEVKEMWFLSLQTCGALLPRVSWLADFCAESGFLDALIGNISQAYKNRIDSSTLSAYEDFLCCASKSSPAAVNIIKSKGAALAKSHHLRTLSKALKEVSEDE